MAWYRQATSHYQSQCWTRSMTPYGDTRPQWVNRIATINLTQRSSGALYTTINYVYKSRMRYLTDYGSKIDMFIKVRFVTYSSQTPTWSTTTKHSSSMMGLLWFVGNIQTMLVIILILKIGSHCIRSIDNVSYSAIPPGDQFCFNKSLDCVCWKARRITIKSAKTWSRGKYH